MARSMTDRLNSNTEAWVPSEGDIIQGVILEISPFKGDYEPYNILTIQITGDDSTETYEGSRRPIEPGDERAFHAYHSVVRKELETKQPQVGDTIGIKFLGDQTPKGGGDTYKGYRVVVDKQDAPSDVEWASSDTPASESVPDATQGVPMGDDDIPF